MYYTVFDAILTRSIYMYTVNSLNRVYTVFTLYSWSLTALCLNFMVTGDRVPSHEDNIIDWEGRKASFQRSPVISNTTGQWSDAPYISLLISHIFTRSSMRSLTTTAHHRRCTLALTVAVLNGVEYAHVSSRHPMPFARQLKRYPKYV